MLYSTYVRLCYYRIQIEVHINFKIASFILQRITIKDHDYICIEKEGEPFSTVTHLQPIMRTIGCEIGIQVEPNKAYHNEQCFAIKIDSKINEFK